jgi:ferredoxin
MRICPTNVIHPAALEAGLEGLWTPILNFRIGTSGCQFNCIACGNLCPTAAIRPINLEERLGKSGYAEKGPIRIGTAFIDRGRCLPWSMDRPCIVCQENCPVSPKAIHTREHFNAVFTPKPLIVESADSTAIQLKHQSLLPDRFATGDYFCIIGEFGSGIHRRIVGNSAASLEISGELPFDSPPASGATVDIMIRLQQPYVEPQHCIGCGVCEHECPVGGKRAIRVTAENESRTPEHRLLPVS